jgi:hypothetical protein
MAGETPTRRFAMGNRGSITFLLVFWGVAELVLNQSVFGDLKSRITSLHFPLSEPRNEAVNDPALAEIRAELSALSQNFALILSHLDHSITTDQKILQRAEERGPAILKNGDLDQSQSDEPPFPYNVLFGLSGNGTGVFHEFQASLKSVLLNAPLDSPLDIHLVANEDAYFALDKTIETTMMKTFQTRNPITIHVYNVQPLLPSWKAFLKRFFRAHWKVDYDVDDSTYLHTIGAFFRLFANHILPSTVQKFLYLDTDAVLMANLQELWKDVAANNPGALLLLLTHGLVSFKLLYGLCRYALSAFVPPSVIPNLQKNIWRGQAIKQICE